MTDAKKASDATGARATASVAKALKPNPVTLLVNHVATAYELVHWNGTTYAVPGPEAPRHLGPRGVAVPLGAEMRRRIVRLSRLAPGIPPVSRATADTVLLHLDALAANGPETPLALRFHHDPLAGRVCLDLGDQAGTVVVIDAHGWALEPCPDGVTLRRSHATKPLPKPTSDGRLTDLAPLLALEPDSTAFRAIVGWLVGLPFAQAVRPGLLLVGPYGSGKSTRLRLATSVLEPSDTSALGSAFGRNFGDDQVRAYHRAVPLWDNLTRVNGDTSDALCTLITGTARETRALYTDNELNVKAVQRPIGLTAVGVPAGLRPDALDRLVVVDVPPVARRMDDAALQAAFDAAHPSLLGAVCDAIAGALAYLEQVPAAGGLRMASHARVLAALDAATAAGWVTGCPGGLLEAFTELGVVVRQRTATEDTFGGALLDLLDHHQGQWQGKASELLAAASLYVPLHERAVGWPTSARRVPEVLNQLRDGLDALGVAWQTTTVRGSTRYNFTRFVPADEGAA